MCSRVYKLHGQQMQLIMLAAYEILKDAKGAVILDSPFISSRKLLSGA